MEQPQTSKYRNQRGNVLFMILAAVALFAALGFAMTQSSIGTGEIDREEARIAAIEILQYAKAVKEAARKQVLLGKATYNQLCFYHPDFPGSPNNYGGGACTPQRQVFDAEGGGMTYWNPDVKWLDSSFSSESQFGHFNYFGDHKIQGIGTNKADLLMGIHYIKEDLCREINRLVDMPFPPPDDNLCCGWDATRHYRGDDDGDWDDAGGSFGGDYAGKSAACVKETDADGYFFYYVLHAR